MINEKLLSLLAINLVSNWIQVPVYLYLCHNRVHKCWNIPLFWWRSCHIKNPDSQAAGCPPCWYSWTFWRCLRSPSFLFLQVKINGPLCSRAMSNFRNELLQFLTTLECLWYWFSLVLVKNLLYTPYKIRCTHFKCIGFSIYTYCIYKALQMFQLWSPRIRIHNLLHNNHLPIQTAQAQRLNNAKAVNFRH